VDIILGLNGYVWISMGTDLEKREMGEGFDAEGVYSDKNDVSCFGSFLS
jgi:exosome complex component RRP4